MRFFGWFRKPGKPPTLRAKKTKKTFKLIGMDICLRWVRCRNCGGGLNLIQDGVERIEILCPDCRQKSRLIVTPFEHNTTLVRTESEEQG